ncbi:hypothetical protein, partial [Elioraea sp. Yellowstone]|uniref:hypothetical protein n=1 Tax=Elioraea sp. Yellowstone TaxID=2592070 RepID=UPI001F36155D
MATQRYSVTPHPIETLLTWVKSGEIAIPESLSRISCGTCEAAQQEHDGGGVEEGVGGGDG